MKEDKGKILEVRSDLLDKGVHSITVTIEIGPNYSPDLKPNSHKSIDIIDSLMILSPLYNGDQVLDRDGYRGTALYHDRKTETVAWCLDDGTPKISERHHLKKVFPDEK